LSTIYIPYKKEPNTFKSHYFATGAVVRDMALGTIYCRGMYPAPFLKIESAIKAVIMKLVASFETKERI